jgi:hypothetical protein
MRFVASILVFTASAVVLQAPPSRGACPGADGCLIAGHVTATLDPPEPCIILRTSKDECYCTSWVSLENNCSVNFRAEDFVFGECMIDGQVYDEQCPAIIPPGSWGSVFLPTDPGLLPGHQEEKLHLTLSGKNIELLVSYDLVETSSGCSCRSAGGARHSVPAALVLLLGLLLALRGGSIAIHPGRRPGF